MKMFEVKNRSVESWGPLAAISESKFNHILNSRRGSTKDMIKKAKKLKTYKITFKKVWYSDSFQIQAENDYDVSAKAREYFKENADSIGFKETPHSKWAGDYAGYDSFSYVKVRS
jgi:hypothetical protein